MFGNINLLDIVLRLPGVFLAITIHEYAHARAADYLGDDTPYLQGRLSLSPLAHIDIVGFLSFLILGFGWAKPVQVNPSRFRNRKWGDLIVSVAGVAANLALAFITVPILYLVAKIPLSTSIATYIYLILYNIIAMNIILFVFNLLPIPPLDGYRVLRDRLFHKNPKFFMQYEQYGFVVLLILIITGASSYIIGYPASWITSLFYSIFRFLQ